MEGDLTLSDPGASMTTTTTGSAYARYTADGKLALYRSIANLAGPNAAGGESKLALIPPSDLALSYSKYDPSSGPVAGTYSMRLARVNGITGNLAWEAKYPDKTASSGFPLLVVPRPTQGDILTYRATLSRSGPGQACQALDGGTSATVTCSGDSYAIDAVAGADGSTAWVWGAPGVDKSIPLNPFSTTQWPFKGNPYQYGGEDAFILGIRGNSTSVGPWMTEGDYGPAIGLAALPGGDLAVTAQGNGYMTFNGGQTLVDQMAFLLFRLDVSNGHILWRTSLKEIPYAVIAAPGGRIAVLFQPSGSNPSVQLFDGSSGALLSTLPLPPSYYPILAAGQTDLSLLGDYSSAVDFDPGNGTDKPSSSRGLYISRYSF